MPITMEDALLVMPCTQSFDANKELRLYYCPTRYHHRDAKFLGLYKDKAVRAVGETSKIVSCSVDLASSAAALLGGSNTLTEDERRRIVEATKEARSRNWDLSSGHKFFLFEELYDTEFQKSTSYGIRNHRRIDLSNILDEVPKSARELATMLESRTWQ